MDRPKAVEIAKELQNTVANLIEDIEKNAEAEIESDIGAIEDLFDQVQVALGR